MGDVEDQLRDREELLSRLTDALPVGLVQLDAQGRITFTNPRLRAMLDAPGATTLVTLFAAAGAQDHRVLEAALMDLFADVPVPDFEVALNRSDGPLVCSLAVRALKDRDGLVSGAIACVSDVTDRVHHTPEPSANTEPVTGCLSRNATWEVLTQVLEPGHIGEGVAVIFVDLDGFKEINDSLGHEAGDRVLAETGRRLISGIREGDHIGRVGGDEFLLICRNVSSKARARTLARRFAKALNGTMETWDEVIQLSGSVGVAWTSEPVTPEVLVARADEAMHANRAARRAKQASQDLSPGEDPFPRQGGVA